MAPTSAPNCHNNRDVGDSSCFQKTVCLRDWWLIKADKDFEGKRLGIAGVTSARDLQPVRLFTSAPIVKRFDVFTLETADRICIVVNGCINRARTSENGFSSKVFRHFLFGFPPYWEEYAAECLDGESVPDVNKEKMDEGLEDPSPVSTPSKSVEENEEGNCVIDVEINLCENMSQRTTIDAPKFSLLSENDYHPSSTINPVINKDDNAKNEVRKNDGSKDTSEDTPQSLGCEINDVRPLELEIQLPEEPLFCYVAQSSERMGDPSSSGKCQEWILRNSNTESATLESVTTQNNASGESPISWSNKDVLPVVVTNTEGVRSRIHSVSVTQDKASPCAQEEKEKTCFASPESLSFKRTRSGRLFSGHQEIRRNQAPVYDVASPCAQEGKEKTKEKAEEKAKEKTCIASPETFNFKRSRSGRLLLPPLEFWRNQVPVYDVDGRIMGIQQDVDDVTPRRGTRSEPQKIQRRTRDSRRSIGANH